MNPTNSSAIGKGPKLDAANTFFIASHFANVLLSLAALVVSVAFTVSLATRKHNIYITTLIALATYGLATCSSSASLSSYSCLMLFPALSGVQREIIDMGSSECTLVLVCYSFFAQMSFMAILAITVERLVALCSIKQKRSAAKSPLGMTIGLLAGTVLAAGTTAWMLHHKPEKNVGFCDFTLLSDTVARKVITGLYVSLMVILAVSIAVLSRLARSILHSYYINRAMLTLRNRVSISRTIRITQVQIWNLVITEGVQIAAFTSLYFGPENPFNLSATSQNAAIVCGFYIPGSLFCLLTGLNQFRLLLKPKPEPKVVVELPVGNMSSLREPEITQDLLSAADEADLRFKQLEDCWTAEYRHTQKRKRSVGTAQAARKKSAPRLQ